MSSLNERRLRIGACSVDPTVDEITRDGTTLKIEPRAMRMLLYLASHAGEVVSVEELLEHVWGELVVTSDSVYTAIAALRRALGDDAREPRYIANVPRRGYRLIAAVEPADEAPGADPAPAADAAPADPVPEISVVGPAGPTARRPSAWLWITPVVLAMIAYPLVWHGRAVNQAAPAGAPASAQAPVLEKSIAVLPFVDMSEQHDQEYFSDGLSEELIDMLTKVPGLRVPARTSSFYFKGRQTKLAEIAHELGVANVLEGSVRKAGNRLRVTAQLIRADTGYHLWSETYDRTPDDIFAIQDDIAAAVVAELKVQLATGSTAARARGTVNPEAYDAFLLGRQFHMQSTIPSWRRAVEAFRKAIDLDPRYAEAHADLAMSEYFLAENTADTALGTHADQDAQTAIDLDPGLAAGYSVRGALRYLRHWDWEGAESDLKRSLELEPANTRVLARYGVLLSYVGRTQDAVAILRKAIELDPLQNTLWQDLGITLAESGDHPRSYDAFRHALAIQPADSFSLFHLARLQLVDGRAQEAIATFRQNSDEEFSSAGVAMAEHTLGHPEASRQALAKLIGMGARDAAYQIAEVYAWCGEKDLAFEWLERAYRQKDGGLVDLKGDFQLGSLHSDARYAALLRRLKLPP